MIQVYKRMQKMREKYVDTLAKLYDYATTVYSKKQYNQWYDTKEGGYTFSSFKSKCDAISKKLTQYGIGVGDKVAIFSQSMPNWSVAFFATVPFGRISIPILPDSSENEVTNIINHSESKVIFVSQRLASKVSQEVRDRMTLGMLYPMYTGSTVYYLPKPPAATLLLKAMKIVKPTTMLTVPMIIEKVYKGSVLPTIKKSRTLSWMNEHMNGLMCRIIGMKLKKTFGGCVTFYGIGGAKLDPEVESFLLKARFPYAIGYGLTETSPLIGYSMHGWRAVGSFGYPVYNVKLKLHNVNPETGEGEVVAKGPNVMLGYYKDPVRTKSVFTEDGWFRTSDIAVQDEKGRFYIKGRNSNMILGPSGENIYPEEIENVLNNVEGVSESIVVERDGRLVALVQPMDNFIEWDKVGEDKLYEKLDGWKAKILSITNKNVNKSSQVSSVEVMKEPFEKTATQKIRRFKYKESAPTVEEEKRNKR